MFRPEGNYAPKVIHSIPNFPRNHLIMLVIIVFMLLVVVIIVYFVPTIIKFTSYLAQVTYNQAQPLQINYVPDQLVSTQIRTIWDGFFKFIIALTVPSVV